MATMGQRILQAEAARLAALSEDEIQAEIHRQTEIAQRVLERDASLPRWRPWDGSGDRPFTLAPRGAGLWG